MIKHTIIYAAITVVCLLTACQNVDYEPAAVTDKEMLSLTISATDFVVEGAEEATRAADNGAITTFENGDKVGVTVLDASGNFIANNLPYIYDGSTWRFDTNNGENKTPAYYDPAMKEYIVYYPYNAAADGIKSVNELKALEAFQPKADQSTEEAYRQSDLMVWSSTDTPMKQITATLTHARASLSLDATVKCTLATGDDVSYKPEALENVNIIIGNKEENLLTYHAEDGSYRCILPDDCSGSLRCFYTHKGKTFCGEYTLINQPGTRYAQVVTADIGEYTLDKAGAGDFYCTREVDGGKDGYLVPKQAADVLDKHNCIGIVFRAGKDDSDNSDYSTPLTVEGPTLTGGTIHGYVMALTNVHNGANDKLKWEWKPKPDGSGENDRFVGTSTDKFDWNGYGNCLKIHEFLTNNNDWEMKHFPAALACETYGNRTVDADGNTITDGRYDWQKSLIAPMNTSGWFLPSMGQLHYLWENKDFLTERINEVKEKTNDSVLKDHILWPDKTLGRLSSSSETSQSVGYNKRYLNLYYGDLDNGTKSLPEAIRAILVF